jgi:hypothetical protein
MTIIKSIMKTELEDGKPVPTASALTDIHPDEDGGFVSMLILDMDAYTGKYGKGHTEESDYSGMAEYWGTLTFNISRNIVIADGWVRFPRVEGPVATVSSSVDFTS